MKCVKLVISSKFTTFRIAFRRAFVLSEREHVLGRS